MNRGQQHLMAGRIMVAILVVAAVLVAGFVGSRMMGDNTEGSRFGGASGVDSLYDAQVDSLDVQVKETFPVEVNVLAKGTLPDGCSEIHGSRSVRNGNTFFVTVTASRSPVARECALALAPFKENIVLDVSGLPAGEYSVDVNGVIGSFTLLSDNTQDGNDK